MLLLVLFIGVSVNFGVSIKNGHCPPASPGAAEICVDLCLTDESCEGNLKCCSNGCGKTCQLSLNETLTETTTETMDIDFALSANVSTVKPLQTENVIVKLLKKPGECPPSRIDRGLAVACFNECKSDANCTGVMKCCYNGCGFMCEAPFNRSIIETTTTAQTQNPQLFDIMPSPCPSGEKPLFHNGTLISCGQNIGTCPPAYFCLFDHSNPKFAVCCPKPPCPIPRGVPGCDWVVGAPGTDGCPQYTQRCTGNVRTVGRDRIEPELGAKPGRCPPVPSGTVGMCVTECFTDKNCSDNRKCCTNGCGMVCQIPLPTCHRQIPPQLPSSNCQYEPQDFGADGCAKPITFVCATDPPTNTDQQLTTTQPINDFPVPTTAPKQQQQQQQQQNSNVKSATLVCNSPPDSGPCRTYSEKWYFDAQVQSCRLFIYGGCMGNANQFTNRSECEKFCGKSQRERAGFCQSFIANPLSSLQNANLCGADDECPDGLKCCQSDHGYACVSTGILTKPGSCPIADFMSVLSSACFDLCQNDFDCPDLHKCCSNGCAKVCSKPFTSKPCEKVRCPLCHQCIERIDGSASCIKTKLDCCPDGSTPVKCVSNPCQFAKCPKHPLARCVVDYCGSCKSLFFDVEGNRLSSC